MILGHLYSVHIPTGNTGNIGNTGNTGDIGNITEWIFWDLWEIHPAKEQKKPTPLLNNKQLLLANCLFLSQWSYYQ